MRSGRLDQQREDLLCMLRLIRNPLPSELTARLFGMTNPLPNLKATLNMAPTMNAPVVRRHPETGERHLDLLIWGSVPSFTKDLKAARKPINAKAETVASSGMFKAALAKRRCLVPPPRSTNGSRHGSEPAILG
jgi:putative SOS response-associated peptidase YedK